MRTPFFSALIAAAILAVPALNARAQNSAPAGNPGTTAPAPNAGIRAPAPAEAGSPAATANQPLLVPNRDNVNQGVNQGNVDNNLAAPQRTVEQLPPAQGIQGDVGVTTHSGAQDDNQWRFRWHNDRWWYWTPSNSWMVWVDNQWQPYHAGMFQSSTGYGTGYSSGHAYPAYGYSGSYGYRYPQYGYGYNYGRPGVTLNFGSSPRYYSGYRGYGYPGYGYGYGGYGSRYGSRGGVSVGRGGVSFGIRF